MRIRYVLHRVGAEPSGIEIDEAVPLVEMWSEERAQMLCPFLGSES